MRLQKFTHSCLLVEDGDARVLVDPGMFSHGFEHLEGLTAVLVTHKHPDHLDVERLGGVLDRNPQARLIADRDSAEQLRADHGIEASVASAGTSYDVGTSIEALGEL